MKVRFNLVLFSILMIPDYRVRVRVRCDNFVDSYLGMTLVSSSTKSLNINICRVMLT